MEDFMQPGMIKVKGNVSAVLGTDTRKVLGYNPYTNELLLQKLNGENSEGFVMPLRKITYVDITKLPNGKL